MLKSCCALIVHCLAKFDRNLTETDMKTIDTRTYLDTTEEEKNAEGYKIT